MTYNDLRKGRVSESGRVYFVTAVTRGRAPLFTDLRCARLLVREMRRLHDEGPVQSLAWVIMPDHLHWLLTLSDGANLSRAIQSLKGRSGRSINLFRGTTASLWQPAFFDRALRRDEDLREVARYLVGNPIRASLVDRLENYPHWDAVWL